MKLASMVPNALWPCLLVAGIATAAPAPPPAGLGGNDHLNGQGNSDCDQGICGANSDGPSHSYYSNHRTGYHHWNVHPSWRDPYRVSKTWLLGFKDFGLTAMIKTVTETVTVDFMVKRAVWTPPKGAGSDYVLPQLTIFPASVIKEACKCFVTLTTATFTKTATATATVTADTNTPTVTKTVATKTNTITLTITTVATITANPTTATKTETATTTDANSPVEPVDNSCNGDPDFTQQQVRGDILFDPTSLIVSDQRAGSAEECYNICNQNPEAISYIFDDRSSQACQCFRSQVCGYLSNNPNGRLIAGDLAVPF
ncbi:MAG: hypothetical protein Q9171_001847 [Xanthocarpia ochracea]